MTDRWQQFYRSTPRQLVALSRYLQEESMSHLKQTYGHRQLRLHFEPYITLLSVKPRRITELADILFISKQACNQVADKLEELGYVRRQSDASDGRAKLLTLSAKGKKLVEDGIRSAHTLDEQCLPYLGAEQLQHLRQSLQRLSGQKEGHLLLMLLPRLGDETHQAFLRALMEQDARLKPAHLECFTLIGGCAGQLKRIARLQGVSVTVVQQLLGDLERWAYVQSDKQGELKLTRSGEALLGQAVAADVVLEQQWQSALGKAVFSNFQKHLAALYQALQLPAKMLGQHTRVEAWARQLQGELSREELRELGALLSALALDQQA